MQKRLSAFGEPFFVCGIVLYTYVIIWCSKYQLHYPTRHR